MPILFLPGLFCGPWWSKPWHAFLGGQRRLIEFAYPGMQGGAYVEEPAAVTIADYVRAVEEVIDQEQGRLAVVGHSMGGMIAYLAALKRPVRALVLVTPAIAQGHVWSTFTEIATSWARLSWGLRGLMSIRRGEMVQPYRGMDSVAYTEVAHHTRRRLLCYSEPAAPLVAKQCLVGILRTEPLAFPSAPTLVVAGMRDVVCPARSVQQFACAIKAEYMSFYGMGHMPPYEESSLYYWSMIDAWLSRHA